MGDETIKNTSLSYIYRCLCISKLTASATSMRKAEENPGQLLETSRSMLPWNANTYFYLGVQQLQLTAPNGGNMQPAEALLSKSLLLDPDFKHTYIQLGICYLRRGK